MIPILSVVGRSNAGKTTLIVKMIAELVRRDYRVATIKHNRHGFEIVKIRNRNYYVLHGQRNAFIEEIERLQ